MPNHSQELRKPGEMGMMVHVCNPSIWVSEAGGLRVGGQLELHSEDWSQKKKKKKIQVRGQSGCTYFNSKKRQMEECRKQGVAQVIPSPTPSRMVEVPLA
jgi:hypothetical protein